jgi:RNA polymerase sigma-70 factor (ECF subfamily)
MNMNMELSEPTKMAVDVGDSEEQVIRRCQQQDVSAFKVIYHEYEQTLLRTAMRVLGQRQDAEDAVQTAFLKLYRGIKSFRFRSKFSTYLFRILLNTCFDMLKQKGRQDIELLDHMEPSHYPEPVLKVQLEGAIKLLPERMRACFVLFAVEGFSQKEIAAILEITVGAVKSNIFQAKTRLRTRLSGSLNKESA